jgi:hypothetical protein
MEGFFVKPDLNIDDKMSGDNSGRMHIDKSTVVRIMPNPLKGMQMVQYNSNTTTGIQPYKDGWTDRERGSI